MGKHRSINRALRELTDPATLVAADDAMERADRRGLERVLGIDRRMQTWNVRSLDVWGNEEDGWEINQSFDAGNIRIPARGPASRVVEQLVRDGYLKESALGRAEAVYGGDSIYDVQDSETGEPLYHVTRGIY